MFRPLAVIVSVLVLSGCAGGTSTEPEAKPTAPDVAAATGVKISGTGYTYNVPDGWDAPPKPVPDANADSAAFSFQDDDGFADNVTTVRAPAGNFTLDNAETSGVQDLEESGSRDVSVNDRISIADSEAAHVTAREEASGTEYTTEAFYIIRDGDVFAVTFSFSTDVSAADRADVTGGVLASWTWTD